MNTYKIKKEMTMKNIYNICEKSLVAVWKVHTKP